MPNASLLPSAACFCSSTTGSFASASFNRLADFPAADASGTVSSATTPRSFDRPIWAWVAPSPPKPPSVPRAGRFSPTLSAGAVTAFDWSSRFLTPSAKDRSCGLTDRLSGTLAANAVGAGAAGGADAVTDTLPGIAPGIAPGSAGPAARRTNGRPELGSEAAATGSEAAAADRFSVIMYRAFADAGFDGATSVPPATRPYLSAYHSSGLPFLTAPKSTFACSASDRANCSRSPNDIASAGWPPPTPAPSFHARSNQSPSRAGAPAANRSPPRDPKGESPRGNRATPPAIATVIAMLAPHIRHRAARAAEPPFRGGIAIVLASEASETGPSAGTRLATTTDSR